MTSNAPEKQQEETNEQVTDNTSAAAPAPVSASSVSAPKKVYEASICTGHTPLPDKFVEGIQALEKELKMPVWMIIQTGDEKQPFGHMDEKVREAFFDAKEELPRNSPVALLIDSPGGYAKSAYQVAVLLRRWCNGFTAVVPRYAKSAATLVALGANEIILGNYAELGPLDAQFMDFEREDYVSGLDQVQALERLHAFAMETVDQSMLLLYGRTRKRIETLLPMTLNFVADLMRPLLEKVDVVHYTHMSRILKVAEEYAIRLLKPKYSDEKAKVIARHLVEKYPEHGFIIDRDEAASFGLEISEPSESVSVIMDSLIPYLGPVNIVGQLKEVGKK